MNKFNLESIKFASVIVIICLLFIMLVWNAFKYLPKDDDNNYQEISVSKEERFLEEDTLKNDASEEIEESEEDISDEVGNSFNENIQKKQQEKFFIVKDETINEEVLNKENSVNDNIQEMINNAKSLKSENKLDEAISTLESASSLTEDNNVKVECFDEIATIHAKNKRYGSALSYAQKSYNLNPTNEREILLARLYYKIGDTNRAQVRMMNVLKRDF